ncbi:hypothetical protein RRG08_000026 [Elysia crispata]|uniref:Uncharacterized protein n=1 Tax=Elysia crispata TaxID=231223 RepID=A0AAE0Y6A9_9GAST|nr:hypothetical protein RRG08_000026 [Elysia crispata]
MGPLILSGPLFAKISLVGSLPPDNDCRMHSNPGCPRSYAASSNACVKIVMFVLLLGGHSDHGPTSKLAEPVTKE